MGPGVAPHLYKASEGDVARMAGADVIFYCGLHLEGKMTEVFERMKARILTVAVTDGIGRRVRGGARRPGGFSSQPTTRSIISGGPTGSRCAGCRGSAPSRRPGRPTSRRWRT